MENPKAGGWRRQASWWKQIKERRRQRLLQMLSRQPRSPMRAWARERWLVQLRQDLAERKRFLEGAIKQIDEFEKVLLTASEQSGRRAYSNVAGARARTSPYGSAEVYAGGSYYDTAGLQADTIRLSSEEEGERSGAQEKGEREADSRRKQQTKGGKGKTRS